MRYDVGGAAAGAENALPDYGVGTKNLGLPSNFFARRDSAFVAFVFNERL